MSGLSGIDGLSLSITIDNCSLAFNRNIIGARHYHLSHTQSSIPLPIYSQQTVRPTRTNPTLSPKGPTPPQMTDTVSPTSPSPRHVHPKLSISTTPRASTPVGPRSPAIASASPDSSPGSDGTSASADAENGPYLDRFQVQRVLGEGSYGKVKLAFDMIAHRTVSFFLFC